MKFHVLTLFPDMVMQGLNTSIIGRAVEGGFISINAVNIRDYTADKHGKVDDYPYGGGAGMLIQVQPVFDAYQAVSEKCRKKPRTIYVTPKGRTFTQAMAEEFAKEEELIFLCGHYEGIDQRVLEEIVTDYVSIGDYVLTGGELPAMVMIDAVSRLVPGVLHNDFSARTETFFNDLLEYPQFSRPEVWHDKWVPQVLLSGNHKKIQEWRLEQSIALTKKERPDLYAKYETTQRLIKHLKKDKRKYIHMMELLAGGRATVVYEDGMNILLCDKESGIYMLAVKSAKEAESILGSKQIARLFDREATIIVEDKEVRDILVKNYHMEANPPCLQACYTKREVLPVFHKDIKKLTLLHKEYVEAHWDSEPRWMEACMEAGQLFGAFVGESPVGFIGRTKEGGMGMLFVEEGYRRRGIGASLEAYMINHLLTEGKTPYCHVYETNTPALKLQEKLGLYLCSEPLWWLNVHCITKKCLHYT